MALVLGCTAPPPPEADAAEVGRPRSGWPLAMASGIEVSDLRVVWAAGTRKRFKGRVLRVDASLRYQAEPTGRRSVWVKASCQRGDSILVSRGEVADDGWLLYEMDRARVGQDIPIHQELFAGQGIDHALPCQIEFRTVPFEVGAMERIEPRFCADGATVATRPCERAPQTEDDPRFTVSDWTLDNKEITFVVTAGERFSRFHAVGLRTECRGGMQMGRAVFRRWQWLDPGEAYAIRMARFFGTDCSFTVERWRESPESEWFTERVELGHACSSDGVIRDGRCPSLEAVAVAQPGPGPRLAVDFEEVRVYPFRRSMDVVLEAKASVIRPPTVVDTVSVEAVCRDGSRKLEPVVDVTRHFDVRHLRLGDQVPLTLETAFHAGKVDCELRVKEGDDEIARWCILGKRRVTCPSKHRR